MKKEIMTCMICGSRIEIGYTKAYWDWCGIHGNDCPFGPKKWWQFWK